MAAIKEKDLPVEGSVASSDYFRIVTSAGESKRISAAPVYDVINADHIVEEGTSGNWTYRKWSSGIAECWGTHSWSVSSWTQWGAQSGIYYSTYSGRISYPTSLFNSTPAIMFSGTFSGSDSFLGASRDHSSAETPSFFFMRIQAGSSGTGNVYIHAIGTWK